VTERWTLAASATGFQLQLHRDLGSQDRNVESAEGNDPKLQFQLRSQLDLPWRTGLDAMLYHVGELPGQSIPEYTRIDLHLDWHATSRLRLSVVGQNLSDPRHPEFGTSATSARSTEVPRSLYVSASWRH
jgi:iron complex outermembrane receptor protein